MNAATGAFVARGLGAPPALALVANGTFAAAAFPITSSAASPSLLSVSPVCTANASQCYAALLLTVGGGSGAENRTWVAVVSLPWNSSGAVPAVLQTADVQTAFSELWGGSLSLAVSLPTNGAEGVVASFEGLLAYGVPAGEDAQRAQASASALLRRRLSAAATSSECPALSRALQTQETGVDAGAPSDPLRGCDMRALRAAMGEERRNAVTAEKRADAIPASPSSGTPGSRSELFIASLNLNITEPPAGGLGPAVVSLAVEGAGAPSAPQRASFGAYPHVTVAAFNGSLYALVRLVARERLALPLPLQPPRFPRRRSCTRTGSAPAACS